MTVYPKHIRDAVLDIAKIIDAEPPRNCFDQIADRLVRLLAQGPAQ